MPSLVLSLTSMMELARVLASMDALMAAQFPWGIGLGVDFLGGAGMGVTLVDAAVDKQLQRGG